MAERIDWERVRGQLAEGEAALNRALVPDAGRFDAVLRARAERLNRRAEQQEAAAGLPVLVFRAGGRRCALGLEALSGIQAYTGCAPVPGAPPHTLGAVSIRGEFAAVVELRTLLGDGGEPPEEGGAGYLLVLRSVDAPLALRVEAIEGIAELDSGRLTPLGSTRFIRGVTPELLSLLDGDALLREA